MCILATRGQCRPHETTQENESERGREECNQATAQFQCLVIVHQSARFHQIHKLSSSSSCRFLFKFGSLMSLQGTRLHFWCPELTCALCNASLCHPMANIRMTGWDETASFFPAWLPTHSRFSSITNQFPRMNQVYLECSYVDHWMGQDLWITCRP